MSDLILHHYPTSPFAEKIRLIFGYKQLAWKSVFIPMIMPKPDLTALTGGYRKTPVLQVGADIYCDTALICDVLEHIGPKPTIYPDAVKGAARIVAQWADSALFTAAMAYNFQPAGVAQVFAGAPVESVQAFVADRGAMRGGAARMASADAAATYKSYLRRLANMLHGQDFLFGAQPCVADFAAYHPLWFTQERTPALAGILDATPEVKSWMARMQAIGHGTPGKCSAEQALQVAQTSTPASLQGEVFQDEHGIALGSAVVIAADNFGLEPTEGELVAATRTRYTLKRSDERAGTVHVHFPRVGFTLKKASA
ncbi:glutathione S-transferase family protein [uncultured Limnohabitans sp.]|jgi:glutathione S-transferase|uniref:glutathione S-transferase family protein n=1 Tax=uncultured Limnohabitans sp. TaxID=768543 RepID=UPI001B425321|nr:glutathione S-transferase family protein [uncultured Limnohabitans sp.]MBP6220400.1 glutathione S-transferase family protein [Limnohabitans sp.]MBP6244607.1 glutathione S-transferase family protein [Limnohabitans sp.]